MKKLTGALSFLLCAQIMIGQVNQKLQSIAEEVIYDKNESPYFLRVKTGTDISINESASWIQETFFEGNTTNVSSIKTEKDEVGFTHVRYQVAISGFPVSNRMIIGHFKNGRLMSVNGDLSTVAPMTNDFSIDEQTALQGALNKIKATKYKWENRAEEEHMRTIFNDKDFSYYPTAKKEIMEKDGKAYAVYVFNIYAEQPLYRANVFVNAATGNVIEEQNLICNADVPATAITKYSGSQSITSDQNGSLYRLRETQRGLGIETYNCKNTTNYTATDFTNTATSWTATNNDQGATDAHWGAEKTYDYFLSQHSRNSINNNGFKLVSYVHYSNSYQNAFWDGQRMTYGDGNGSSLKIFTTLDICAHEISHGLNSNSAGLIYQNESGALSESYSDIFGASIENYARPNNWNWKIGEDMTSNGMGLRTMANPSSYGDPDTYGGSNYYVGTQDNGGVHTNSGVSNFWYYLLTMGGTGTNDLSNAYSVTGLGFNKASKIAFRALTVYYTPSTNFNAARNLSIQAAKDLYGSCSQEVISTTNAWYAVGVGAQYVPGLIGPNFIASSTNYCYFPANVSFTNTTINGLAYTWDFGDGTTGTGTNTAHTYTANGNYNIKLIANGCNNGIDSMIKSSYITVNMPSVPVANDIAVCYNNPATLTASGNGTLTWYNGPSTSSFLNSGPTFVTPSLTNSTVYYVANGGYVAPAVGGMASNTGGGFLNNTAPYLLFNVNQTSVLNSVVVYAIGSGNRIIQLRNSNNTVLNAITASLSPGANTVILNFNLNPGNNYRLGLSSTSATGLYRSISGMSYPYSIGGLVDITSSSTGNNAYYWFYNWEVTKTTCLSAKVPINVSINPLPDVSMFASLFTVCQADDILLSGHPAGGTFSGNGVTGSTFNASQLGAGTHPIHYIYTDENNCSGTASTSLVVDVCTGISDSKIETGISAYPNPVKDQLTIRCEISNVTADITDASGRKVMSEKLLNGTQHINTTGISKGLYLLNLYDESGRTLKTIKIVRE